MAIDLRGRSAPRIRAPRSQGVAEEGACRSRATRRAVAAQGIRLGVRIGEQPTGRIAIDFSGDRLDAGVREAALLETLADAGMKIDDLDQWECDAKGTEIGLTPSPRTG